MKSARSEPRRVARKQVLPSVKEYSRLKIGGMVLVPGDTVVVSEYYDLETYATIVRITGDPSHPNTSKVTVRWFYKPSSVFVNVPEFVGLDELFDSDHEDDIFVQTLTSKIRVITLSDYMQLRTVPDDVYYTRATFECKRNRLNPPPEAWEKVCTCRSVLSPNEVYRICAACRKYFHPECCQSPDEERWTCHLCSRA